MAEGQTVQHPRRFELAKAHREHVRPGSEVALVVAGGGRRAALGTALGEVAPALQGHLARCADCAETRFQGECPNCGGDLVARPIRPPAMLAKYPASTERYTKAHAACAA